MMAVLFPKKVPAFSRALGESDEAFYSEPDVLSESELLIPFSIKWEAKINTLIIGVGSAQCEVLSAIVDFSKGTKVRMVNFSISNRVVVSCSAFAFGCGSLIWLCDTQERDTCYGFEKWVNALFSSFSFDHNACIYVLTDAPTSEYLSDFKPSAPFMRALKTPRAFASLCADVKLLEPPNIVAGFAAPIMTYCIYRSLPACVLIIYYENLRASPAKNDISAMVSPILSSVKEFQPFLLNDYASSRSAAHNFDQMYI